MTFTAPSLPLIRWPVGLFETKAPRTRRRDIAVAVAHLDNRLRADIGLPQQIERAERSHEAAARIAMLAWR